MDTVLTMTLNPHKELCAVYKSGGAPVESEHIKRCAPPHHITADSHPQHRPPPPATARSCPLPAEYTPRWQNGNRRGAARVRVPSGAHPCAASHRVSSFEPLVQRRPTRSLEPALDGRPRLSVGVLISPLWSRIPPCMDYKPPQLPPPDCLTGHDCFPPGQALPSPLALTLPAHPAAARTLRR